MFGKFQWIAVGLALPIATGNLCGQTGKVSNAELVAHINENGVDVSLRYQTTTTPNDSVVSIATVTMGSTRIENVTASVNGVPSEVTLTTVNALRIEGIIEWHQLAQTNQSEIVIEYHVAPKRQTAFVGKGVIHIPVLGIEWAPSSTLPNTFTANVTLPSKLHVFDTFPSRMNQTATAHADSTQYETQLNIVPGVMIFRWSDRPVWFSPTRGANIAIVTLFLTLSVIGLQRLRKVSTA